MVQISKTKIVLCRPKYQQLNFFLGKTWNFVSISSGSRSGEQKMAPEAGFWAFLTLSFWIRCRYIQK